MMAFSTTVKNGSNLTMETATGHIEAMAITHRYSELSMTQ